MLSWLTKRSLLRDVLWAVLAATVVLGLWHFGTFEPQELRLLDRRHRTRPPIAAGEDIVLVTIDDTSIQFIGRWPWPRSTHAELVKLLTEAGARVIALDVVFAEASEEAEDQALAQAIADSGRVVLPVFVPPEETDGIITQTKVLEPLDELAAGTAALGHIGLAEDSDGRFRRVAPFVDENVRGALIPAFSLVAVCEYLGVPVPRHGEFAGRSVPLGEHHRVFTDGQGGFQCSYFSGAEPEALGRGIRQVRYVEVLYGGVPAEVFRDKLVVVGATARGIGEQFFLAPIPTLPISGAEVHATAMETLLRNASIRKPTRVGYGLALFVVSSCFAFCLLRLRLYDATYSVLGAAGLLWLVWLIAEWRFRAAHVWIEYYPFLALVLGALAVQVLWRLADALCLVLRRRAELDLITEVGARASSSSELADDFRLALRAALSVADTKVGALWGLDENEAAHSLEVVAGFLADSVVEKRILPGHGVLGRLVAGDDAAIVQDPRHGELGDASPLPPEYPSLALLPLRARGRCVGLLAIGKRRSQTFEPEELQLLRTIASQSGLDLDNARLVQKLQRMFVATLGALIKALEAKDAYTRGHSDRVTEFAVLVGRRRGLSEDYLETLRLAGEVHDIGKIGMPDIVLNKPGTLTDGEYEAFKSHAQLTGDILEDLDWLREVRDIAMHHHERWDGRGYPDGLKGESTPLGARILAIADAHDAMTSDRPYRNGMPQKKAVAIIVEEAGTQLDPHLVEDFLRVPDAPWTDAAQAVLREREETALAPAAPEE